jgi:hypothetical protein
MYAPEHRYHPTVIYRDLQPRDTRQPDTPALSLTHAQSVD